VTATESFWTWWRSLGATKTGKDNSPADAGQFIERLPAGRGVPETLHEGTPTGTGTPPNAKRSTERGEGRMKLIAALTKHHRYADGGCLNLEPVGNNELAKAAEVSRSTASEFFNQNFKGHAKYRALCRDSSGLVASLKLLNNEFAPHDFLYGRRPADEDDRENE
jgi:hypothetical protein